MTRRRQVTAAVAVAFAAARLYRRRVRTWLFTWGATPEEAARRLPGDELLERAGIVATRAITIDAPASAVFPWLVQMGSGRGGAYTYDWIENLLGLDMHSADTIVPELQQLEVGDVLRGPKQGSGMRVEILEPDRVLATRSEDGTWAWTFVLVEDGGRTRLLSRNRIAVGHSPGARLGMAVMEPGSLVMERKMLLGIKERAERLAARPS
ncbi:MAG TPA: SRPBCC family protein [Coriobacteriia bacterium]